MEDPCFSGNPLVTGEPRLRFYAGARLTTAEGLPLGTVCVLDHQPRDLTDQQGLTLKALARQVMTLLELRRAQAERDAARAAQEKAEQAHHLLVRELHHRVRNILATVLSILRSTARSATSLDQFCAALTARITALAKIHTRLAEHEQQVVGLCDLLNLELAAYDGYTGQRVRLSGPEVALASEIALPLGMAVHELCINAAKHGALSTRRGQVAVEWEIRQEGDTRLLHLTWVEQAGPHVHSPRREGFGTRMLQEVLTAQVEAKVVVDYEPHGLQVRLEMPLD